MYVRLFPLISLALFGGGVALIVASVATGEGRLVLFLVFPGIVTGGILGILGFLLIVLAFLVGFLQFGRIMAAAPPASHQPWEPPCMEPPPSGSPRSETPRRRFGGILLLGPVPIVFGTDRKITLAIVVLGIVLTAAALVLFLLVFR
jgi:uncharacterized protein (TIGR00304 family)